MGYYSNFELFVSGLNDESEWENVWAAMGDVGIQDIFAHKFPNSCDGDSVYVSDYYWEPSTKVLSFYSDEMYKWYEEIDEMTELSKLLPGLIFKIHRNGEESDDVTDDYFVNGEYECCEWAPKPPSHPEWFEAFEWKGND